MLQRVPPDGKIDEERSHRLRRAYPEYNWYSTRESPLTRDARKDAIDTLAALCREMLARIAEESSDDSLGDIDGVLVKAAKAAHALGFRGAPIQRIHYERGIDHEYDPHDDDNCSPAPLAYRLFAHLHLEYAHIFGYRLHDPTGDPNPIEVFVSGIAYRDGDQDGMPSGLISPDDFNIPGAKATATSWLQRWVRWLQNVTEEPAEQSVAERRAVDQDDGAARKQDQSAPPSSAAGKEPEIPPFDEDSGDWCKSTEAASIEKLESGTLGKYRRKPDARYVADDSKSGVDRDGRMWRRVGTDNSHPWYYVPSLKNQSDKKK